MLVGLMALFGPAACFLGNEQGTGDRERGEVKALELEVGSCFNEAGPESETVLTVIVVPCEEPHLFEVYHSFELEDGPYPGDESVEDRWIAGCLAEFEAFVGMSFDESELDISGIFPTEDTWVGVGDREVLCSVTPVDGEPRSGSARGSGI